jgi:hypothetical protein
MEITKSVLFYPPLDTIYPPSKRLRRDPRSPLRAQQFAMEKIEPE